MPGRRSSRNGPAAVLTAALLAVALALVGRSAAPVETVAVLARPAAAPRWPMFGGGTHRNMVNPFAKNLPAVRSVGEDNEPRKNIKWAADLGTKAFGGPVVADGRVFIGTNNQRPRDAKHVDPKTGWPIDLGVLMCFRESDGAFLWQAVHEKLAAGRVNDWPLEGLPSTPAVDGDRLYYVTPAGGVVCASTADGKIVWGYDLRAKLGVVPYYCNNCSPLVVAGRVFVVTGNGVDDDGKVVNPKAPSFVALTADDGRLLWHSNLPGDRIIEGPLSSPVYADAGGRPQVIFPGGDGWLYGFEPATGRPLRKFDCDPRRPKPDPNTSTISNYFVGTPVVVGDRLFVGLGVHPEHPQATRSSYFLCVDVTKMGDVSPTSLDANDPANKNSALVWAFGGPIEPRPMRGRRVRFGRTISTAAVHDGFIYIPEESGYLHCLDAKTGRRCWEYDFKCAVWGSAYWADGRVYVGTEDGEVVIFAPGRECRVLAKIDMEETIYSTPVAANGVLYIQTQTKLYALRRE